MDEDSDGKVLELVAQRTQRDRRAQPEPLRPPQHHEPLRPPQHHEPLWRELAGRVLRSERLQTRRTLQQVAERAGVSPQYLSEVERGRKDPSSEMLESICGALGLRLSELLVSSGLMLRMQSAGGSPAARPSGVTSMAA